MKESDSEGCKWLITWNRDVADGVVCVPSPTSHSTTAALPADS